MELDLRKLRYFLVTADELNFGRAAEKLFIAQPVLSRQIASLEIELDAVLFDRSSRGTQLTETGARLAAEARVLLESAAALQRRARVLSGGGQHLTIGVMPGMSVAKLIKRLSEEHPHVTVDIVPTTWHSQDAVVRDGRADLSVVRMPTSSDDDLAVVPLFSERCYVAMGSGNPLVQSDAIYVKEIACQNLLQPSEAFPQWREAALALSPETFLARSPDIDNPPDLPFAAVEELLALVARNHGIALLPESSRYLYSGADVEFRRVVDFDDLSFGVVYDEQRWTPLFMDVLDFSYEELALACPLRTPLSGVPRAVAADAGTSIA